jgi:small subunit ribosomal protein S9
MTTRNYGTGRRKKAVARVWLWDGKGEVKVNKKALNDYFTNETYRNYINQPLVVTDLVGKMNVLATVQGGGHSGQAEAIRLGLARAIVQMDEGHKKALRLAGFLTRDPRVKERKKYGKRGARASFQFSKR